MLLTPTMIGAVLAGIRLWTLFWAALHKIEEIPYVRDMLTTNDCLGTHHRPVPASARRAPMKVQQELMRHVDIRTRMNVYGKAMDASKREARGKVVRMVLAAKVA
jgi:hypothetical protein